MAPESFVTEYLRLGLSFNRLEDGFVDAYTGDPALRREVENAPRPQAADLAREARRLRGELPGAALSAERTRFIDAHLVALECSARKFAGEPVGFIDEVAAYFDVRITKGNEDDYRAAHRLLDEALPGAGSLPQRMTAHRTAEEIPVDKLPEAVEAFSSALREKVRARYTLPDEEFVEYQVVSDQPWSGFNYYLGGYRSRVAINSDQKVRMSDLPHLIAHEAYPGHHTEHCRKEQGLVGSGQAEQTIFLVNTPQCLMAEGLADLALGAIVGKGWGRWAQEIYADLGMRFDGDRAEQLSDASAGLLNVRQDAAIMLHDEHRSVDDVARYLERWNLATPARARHQLRFLESSLWRAYISTYVEGYQLLGRWLDDLGPGEDRAERFARLLDEPLIPSVLRGE
jgi:hypothetical protein